MGVGRGGTGQEYESLGMSTGFLECSHGKGGLAPGHGSPAGALIVGHPDHTFALKQCPQQNFRGHPQQPGEEAV